MRSLNASKKPKCAGAAEGTKDCGHGVKRTPTAKVIERHARQGETPPGALRAIEKDGSLAEVGKDVLLNVVAPVGAVGIRVRLTDQRTDPPDDAGVE